MAPTTFDPSKDIPSLTGKIILITGGTAGVGAGTITGLARCTPAHLLFTGRNADSAETTISKVRAVAPGIRISFLPCDLSDLASVQTTANKLLSDLPHLDALMCNAGIMAKPPSLSRDGYEIQFATNHLGHALLVKKLLPLLQKSPDPRIVMVSSTAWRGAPSGGIQFPKLKSPQDMPMGRWLRYGQSKLANMLYARELAKRFPGVLSFSITPGVVNTALVSESSPFTKAIVYLTSRVQTVEEGTHNLLWAITAPKETIKPGAFYEPVGLLSTLATKASKDEALAETLWNWTEAELEKWM
ncbi:hypothetical protein B0H67DRAFT_602654 [Lasiosphaeris hirsuta]|uniref:Oxidoreductase n=1 Tax=Lasiosphaeris hirsuta TaxID=260670 RepID=A0AA40A1B8_9PEZI|nr:hypothetical protein B0H67DRAFT_602654 [Lasiosphaeris hirsuta]